MSDKRRRNVFRLLLSAVFMVYFFVAARPMESELLVRREWVTDVSPKKLPESPLAARSDAPRSFRLGKTFGYVFDSGEVLFSQDAAFGVAVSDHAWALQPSVPGSFSVFSPLRERLFDVNDGSLPLIRGDRVFSVTKDRAGISEFDLTGKRLYSRDFSSLMTDFAVTDSRSIIGLLEGRIEMIDTEGARLMELAPGGSRIPVTLGVALSADASSIAAISGADPQRLLLLDRKADGFQIVHHQYLASDFRKRIPLVFDTTGKYLLFEQEGEVATFDRGTKRLAVFPVRGNVFALEAGGSGNMVLALAVGNGGAELSALRPPMTRAFRVPFAGMEFFLRVDGASFIVGSDGVLARFTLTEG